jgi:hypothetical protein
MRSMAGRAGAGPGVAGPAAQPQLGQQQHQQHSTSTPASMFAAAPLKVDWYWS